jgi:hypothetical protein
MKTMDWWFVAVGILMMAAAVVSPKAGIRLTRGGRPGGSGTEVKATFAVRASTFLIGLLLTGLGFYKAF